MFREWLRYKEIHTTCMGSLIMQMLNLPPCKMNMFVLQTSLICCITFLFPCFYASYPPNHIPQSPLS